MDYVDRRPSDIQDTYRSISVRDNNKASAKRLGKKEDKRQEFLNALLLLKNSHSIILSKIFLNNPFQVFN